MEKPAEPSAKRSSIMAETPENEFNAFLDSWKTDPCDAKKVILAYREQLAATNGVELLIRGETTMNIQSPAAARFLRHDRCGGR